VTSGPLWNLDHIGPCVYVDVRLWGSSPTLVFEYGLDQHIRPLDWEGGFVGSIALPLLALLGEDSCLVQQKTIALPSNLACHGKVFLASVGEPNQQSRERSRDVGSCFLLPLVNREDDLGIVTCS